MGTATDEAENKPDGLLTDLSEREGSKLQEAQKAFLGRDGLWRTF